jgi:Kef-type K+ transport system membrane component KefB/voltage-gated potassium channel Kch
MENIFFDIALIIIVATIIAYISKLLKQPLIFSYVITGLIHGPVGLDILVKLGVANFFAGYNIDIIKYWINDLENIKVLSEIGIAFLLFVVALELDLKKLKDIGLIASVGGTVKSLVLFVTGFLAATYFGFLSTEAVYLGLIVAFSSTMVVVKLLSDKQEIDTLHGRIIIGILLMEDILAILALSILNTLGNFHVAFLIVALLKGIGLLVIAILFGKYIFPYLFKFAARSQELLFMMSVTACFLFASFAHMLGFSIAIGAFIAGITLANLPYYLQIIAKIKPLRDFFGVMFFVTLGMSLKINSLGKLIIPLVVFTLIIVILKPIVIMVISSFFGYAKRTAFITSISLAQISEFSLIIVAQGLVLGQISDDIFTISVILAIITISATSYFIKYDSWIYHKLRRELKIFKTPAKDMHYLPSKKQYDVILIGYDRIGYTLNKTVKKIHKSLLIVDFNPDIIKRLIREKIPCIYGDIGDLEILERLDFKKAQIVISTVPDEQTNLLLLKEIKTKSKSTLVFVTGSRIDDALTLYKNKADYVILPHFLGGDHFSIMLEDISGDFKKLIKNKLNHIHELKRRKSIGHEHPRHKRKKEN